ncbi:MAG: SpoIIE family protein phosphatase [Bacteroidia bacterium]|nr:SpoIIE family protein phosphatase [Bacteroidia bacterium]
MKKPTILCVDDEKIILDSLEEQINYRLGREFEILLAEGGEEGLEVINELNEEGKDLAVVVSDQLMPGMKGDEFLIRVHNMHPETLKILLTGQASIDAVRNAINNAHLYRYVIKPWEENDLMLTIEEAGRSYLQYLQLIEHNRLLRALNKSSQEISGEIDIKRLINRFMQNVMENAGAEKGFLLMERDGVLAIEAIAAATQQTAKDLQSKFANESNSFTSHVLEIITKTIENDEFPNHRFVTPISRKGKSLGYLFLENNSSHSAFSYNQREVLQMLASQAAISIENANLYARVQEKTAELQEEKEKVEKINSLLNDKNKDILDSIRYAKRIQESIMPEKDLLTYYFPESFILYKPKDIVSGDFYWFTTRNDKLFIAAVDCTGHGVPGAFMSVIGSNILGQVVNEYNIADTEAILDMMNFRVSTTLKQGAEGSESNDGMDIALCIIDIENKQIQFSGANRSMYILRNGDLVEYKSDKFPIGGRLFQNRERSYSKHLVDIQPGDILYIFTDGITDQFGLVGDQEKKYTFRRLQLLLTGLQETPLTEQAKVIDKEIEHWRGSVEQTDDILIIGIKF